MTGKRMISLLVALLLVVGLLPVAASAEGDFAGGTGAESDPYLIETKYHLDNVRNDLSAHYKMIADIEFTGADFASGGDFYHDGTGWQPIGTSTASGYVFTGSFDGNGHTVTGLQISITADGAADAALFGFVKGGEIKNLGMVDGSIYAKSVSDYVCAGGVVGYVFGGGTITNCYNTGSITVEIPNDHTTRAGGVVAESANATVTGCYNTGTVTVTHTGSGKAWAGGVVGSTSGTSITDCHNTGAVTITAKYAYAGGVAGGTEGEDAITGCYNTGAVSAKTTVEYSDAYAGGIAGRYGVFTNCYNAGTVLATVKEANSDVFAGGIVGAAPASVTGCYNTAEVSAKYSGARSYSYAGGIAGQLSGGVSDCYNTGYVFSTYGDGGGIVGSASTKPVTNCYNTGRVVSSYRPGSIAGSGSNLTNCYYLENINPAVGTGSATAVSCTEEQLKQQATFAGFDFDKVWTMAGDADYPYPELRSFIQSVLQSIAVTTQPTKLTYLEGKDALDVTGGRITAFYSDGSVEEVDMTPEMVTGFDNTVIGMQTLTVTYEGKTDAFTVEIVADILPGDVDGNGTVNILDVMAIINIITGTLEPTDAQRLAADLNGDKAVNILDAMALISVITGA